MIKDRSPQKCGCHVDTHGSIDPITDDHKKNGYGCGIKNGELDEAAFGDDLFPEYGQQNRPDPVKKGCKDKANQHGYDCCGGRIVHTNPLFFYALQKEKDLFGKALVNRFNV